MGQTANDAKEGVRSPGPAHRLARRGRAAATRRATLVLAVVAMVSGVAGGVYGAASSRPAAAQSLTTAWHDGAFQENVGGVVSESDIALGEPNTSDTQFMPLGNGSLGVAAWAANGFTAQLNRNDTMPDRLSPGQVNIPGLETMTSASDFSGYLDIYNGVLDESGGGMTMKAWVPAATDELIVEVSGANPSVQQTATLSLWSGRSPTASASGGYGALAQTWSDNSQTGYSGQTFGAMAGITAGGQDVTASVVNSTEVEVSFYPSSNGSFVVVVPCPEWTGGNAISTAESIAGPATTTSAAALLATQANWWNNFWANTGLVQMSSSDGTAQYLENIRTLEIYDEASSMKVGQYPGSQAGLADMFNYNEDTQDWYPAGYWLWNLRGQIQTNLSAGDYNLNLPIFQMYLNDLPAIESWTRANMGGLPGACVPETMRFNGNGYYDGDGTWDASCDEGASPNFNAETITSGAEIALWMWQQYQDTANTSFLQTYWPFMEAVAQFLLSYQGVSNGYLQSTANAHETQWAVTDPTTDIAATQAMCNAIIAAGAVLGSSDSIVGQCKTAETEIQPYPRVSQSNLSDLLNTTSSSASTAASLDAAAADVIGDSYQPSATIHNVENVGLEPVWPYGVIGDDTVVNGDNLTALADRTYDYRPNTNTPDWNYDAIQAARLDMASQVESDLVTSTQTYQQYPSGLAVWETYQQNEPYIEQSSNVAATIDEALATDYDGTLRFAPAWPSNWNVSGTVYVQGGSKVDVQVQAGTITTAAIQAGSTMTMAVRNPWPGGQAQVVNGSTGVVVVPATSATNFNVPVTAGSTYLVEQPSSPTTLYSFAEVTGTQAVTYKTLGSVHIGLPGNTVTTTTPGGTTTTQPSSGGGFPSGYGTLKVANDSLCLDSYGNTANAGAVIDQWACNGGSNQDFQFVPTSGGYGELQVESSGQDVTAIAEGSSSASAQGVPDIVQEPVSGTSAAQWLPEQQSDGSWQFKNQNSGLCLDVYGATSNQGQQLDQWPCKNAPGTNQDFLASATGPGSGTTTTTQPTTTTTQPTTTTTVPSGFPSGYHTLVVANDNLCLDSFGNTANAGAIIDQWACNGGSNQDFQFVPTSGGYGELQVESSGQDVTAIAEGSSSASAQGVPDIVQEPVSGTSAAQWLPEQQSDGSWQFKNQNSGLCLDVYGATSNQGQQLDQWPCKNAPGTNQDFKAQ
jgi:hypothetical protein